MGARYKAVYREGKLFAEYDNGVLTYLDPAYSSPKRSEHAMPYVVRDIGEYVSPVDGTHITSRPQHRDHLKAHDLVEVGTEPIGHMSAPEPEKPAVDRELGEAIKRRLEEVEALPQDTYDEHIKIQQAEHAEVAALAVAS